jgi:hypothetical protein
MCITQAMKLTTAAAGAIIFIRKAARGFRGQPRDGSLLKSFLPHLRLEWTSTIPRQLTMRPSLGSIREIGNPPVQIKARTKIGMTINTAKVIEENKLNRISLKENLC